MPPSWTLRDLEAAAQAEALAAATTAEQAANAAAPAGGDGGGPDGVPGGAGGLWSVDGGDRDEGGWSPGSAAAARAAAGLDGAVAGSGARDRNALRRDLDAWAQRHGVDRLAVNERAAHANRRLWVGAAADGVIGVEGRLPTIGGAHVVAAIDALARPAGDGDTRTFAQRRADALVALATRSLAGQTLNPHAAEDPSHGGARHGGAGHGGSGHGGSRHGAAQQGGARETGAGDSVAPGGTSQGGVPSAQVLLITTAEALHDTPGAEPSQLDGVGAVSGGTARQVCCDADVTTVTVDREGTVLDVGRTRRTPSARQLRRTRPYRDSREAGTATTTFTSTAGTSRPTTPAGSPSSAPPTGDYPADPPTPTPSGDPNPPAHEHPSAMPSNPRLRPRPSIKGPSLRDGHHRDCENRLRRLRRFTTHCSRATQPRIR